jgi:hypothetical protein
VLIQQPSTNWPSARTKTSGSVPLAIEPDGGLKVGEGSLLWASSSFFMSRVRDDKGDPLGVYVHDQTWIETMERHRLLALLAPRDHSKTWTSRSYIAWRLWKHNRAPDGTLYEDNREGNFEVVIFSSNMDIARDALFAGLQQFLVDNPQLFGDLLPPHVGNKGNPDWSKSFLRLRNGATVMPKAIGSATRGLHPDLIVVDDILSDKNSITALQRGRVWSYLIGTIAPMPGPDGQLIVIGTAQHFDDALHRLRRDKRFYWRKYRAVNWKTGRVLWPERHDLADLEGIRDADPVIFSKEYQNDPRDDAASLFPYSTTAGAVLRGTGLSFINELGPTARESGWFVLGSNDIAISEVMIGAYNRYTGERRLLWATRQKGLTFDEQVTQMRDVCKRFSVDLMVIEQNVAQKWLKQHLVKYAETASRVYGHTTGIEKQSLEEGVPTMKIVLRNELWTWPSGEDAEGNVLDLETRDFIRELRAELNAFGYVDGKLQGVGSHDDTVMALYLWERGVRMIEALPEMPVDVVVHAEDVDIPERVKIGDDL